MRPCRRLLTRHATRSRHAGRASAPALQRHLLADFRDLWRLCALAGRVRAARPGLAGQRVQRRRARWAWRAACQHAAANCCCRHGHGHRPSMSGGRTQPQTRAGMNDLETSRVMHPRGSRAAVRSTPSSSSGRAAGWMHSHRHCPPQAGREPQRVKAQADAPGAHPAAETPAPSRRPGPAQLPGTRATGRRYRAGRRPGRAEAPPALVGTDRLTRSSEQPGRVGGRDHQARRPRVPRPQGGHLQAAASLELPSHWKACPPSNPPSC